MFGLAAPGLISKFEFRGKSLLISSIDLRCDLAVIAGLVFVLLFGACTVVRRVAARARTSHHLRALAGIMLAPCS